MFDISFFEIMVISMIALIVVGPERLPYVARTLGHIVGKCRQFIYSVKTDIHNEIRMEELKDMHHTMQETAQSIKDSVHREINEIQSAAQMETQNNPAKTQSASTDHPRMHSEDDAPAEPSQPGQQHSSDKHPPS